jgi:hypothetical protein
VISDYRSAKKEARHTQRLGLPLVSIYLSSLLVITSLGIYIYSVSSLISLMDESLREYRVNCEMASFIMMAADANPAKDINGSITMSVDVLDLSVIHLSAYERLQRRHKKTLTVTDILRIHLHVPNPICNTLIPMFLCQ